MVFRGIGILAFKDILTPSFGITPRLEGILTLLTILTPTFEFDGG